MSGKAISGHSRKQNAQLRQPTCARCGKRVKDGKGKHVTGTGLLCPKCAPKAR